MKANKAAQKALINFLNRVYREIREVEAEWGIRVEESDYRPRIEYFHDAVRAFSAAGGKGSEGRDRLSVEMLAYDIGMLRYIQAEPIPTARNKVGKLSPFKDVATGDLPRVNGDLAGLKPDASVKFRLADMYKSYAVLFSALLADAAEHNYLSRIGDSNAEVEDLAEFMQSVKEQGANPQINLDDMAERLVRTPDLMNKIIAAFHSGKLKKRTDAKDAYKKLKDIGQAVDKENKAIEQAHMAYATGQLAIYENSRDVIKKMAIKGFNIVGDFVEDAIAAARRDERGR
jgi:hypothetical protein